MSKHLDLLKEKRKELDKQIKKEEAKKITKKGNLKFYEYNQNNSGGRFEVNKKLCHRIVIQAHNADEARDKALRLGIYFDGCSIGVDCSCCGDRWYETADETTLPYRYGTFALKDAKESGYDYKPTTWKGYNEDKPNPKQYDLIFHTIEEYMQYQADKYGFTDPDARIFYYDGRVIEIKSKNG